ncbi:hypothetical protein ACVJGB_004001 [Bradyrhizobium liaoningense]
MVHFGVDIAGRQRVDADVLPRQLQRHRPGRLDDAGLGDRVGRDRLQDAGAEHGGDVDDVAFLLARDHAAGDFGREEIGAFQIGTDHRVPVRLGLLGRELLDGDAGIVDQHGDGAERGFDGVDSPGDRGDVGDIERDRGRAAALAADLLLEALQLVGLPRGERNRRTMRRQHPCKLPAQPLARARDEDGFFTDVE